ncbi:hypothetical protein BX616_004353 [Lobosporangium transversale]|uniref:Uncharacterized protein n=1 Tax=Lobosporangium transversale TaxID=64571 RepID=A0A1Y2H1B3_9FUNG|nr:hypothetical protein BCR41DRAFT_418425 [Lobosporangium transversale]KAF9898202.1 hypothetical protein BX616_004353 [Lobosporangium transversale]ORZ28337.1 hypothetical protein BCR41DRAFT_418425 [Lobosporangium transversale]|eukprot:XP_021886022.1 hypothetical protein BCR41DRAFT_418425 [Lobosporangium transversale]
MDYHQYDDVCSQLLHLNHASRYYSKGYQRSKAVACCQLHGYTPLDNSTSHDHLSSYHEYSYHPSPLANTVPNYTSTPLSISETSVVNVEQSHDHQLINTYEWLPFPQDQYNLDRPYESQNISHDLGTATMTTAATTLDSFGPPPYGASALLENGPLQARRTKSPLTLSYLADGSQGTEPRAQLYTTTFTEGAAITSGQDVATLSTPSLNLDPRSLTRRMNERSLSISSSASASSAISISTSTSSWSSWSSAPSEMDLDAAVRWDSGLQNRQAGECSTIRKNKKLPPPTLSPALVVPTITAVSSQQQQQQQQVQLQHQKQQQKAESCWSIADDNCSNISAYSGSESDYDDALSDTWLHCHSDDLLTTPYHCKHLALSASIWGPGWYQVEPLPPSLIKAMQQYEQELQAQALEKATAAQPATNLRAKSKKAKKQARAAAAAAAATATEITATSSITGQAANSEIKDTSFASRATNPKVSSTLCSARLPRSLQFID